MIEKEPVKIRHVLADVVIIQPDFVIINQRKYRILNNYRDAIDLDLLREKYDPYLDKYDYLLGDISSDKLRLKGFYKSNSPKINIDKKFDSIEDYLFEYVNPGAPFFILELIEAKKTRISNKFKKPYKERRESVKPAKGRPSSRSKVSPQKKPNNFVIKKRKDSEA